MKDMGRAKLRLALAVISGRKPVDRLTASELQLIGYSHAQFWAGDSVNSDSVKQLCEDFLYDCFAATWEYYDE